MLDWMKHKLESRFLEEISITSDMQMTPPYGRKWRTKEPLDERERGEWKCWLKTQHPENMAFSPITSWQIEREIMETVTDLFFGGGCSKSLPTVTEAMKLKDACSLEEKLWPTYFTHKGLSSQSYGFSNSHVWMWQLDYKESWVPNNWYFWTVVLEKILESP